MARRPTWEGKGTPAEMWLLQLDMANHSQWSSSLGSYPDAFSYRRQFAECVTAAVSEFGFDRLAWAGDGGLFVAEGRQSVRDPINAANRVHQVFDDWKREVRQGEVLGLRVSLHRARVTTADDPAFCFGSELNDFMKYEREMRDAASCRSIVVTQRIYEELTFEQQQQWSPLHSSVGALGPVFSFRPEDNLPAVQPLRLEWLSGAWHNEESDSWGYSRTDDAGRTKFVYCYGGDSSHTGNYENWQHDGVDLVGTFAWVTSPISGRFRLTPNATNSELTGGWWYAEDLPDPGVPALNTLGLHPSRWIMVEKAFPAWVESALGK